MKKKCSSRSLTCDMFQPPLGNYIVEGIQINLQETYKETIFSFTEVVSCIIVTGYLLLTPRADFLRVWKQGNGMRATYAVLLKACVATSNTAAAEMIVKVLRGTCIETVREHGAENSL